MTPGEAYAKGTLVRVRGIMDRTGKPYPFDCGLVLHPETDRVIVVAPLLRYLRGQTAAHCRSYFARMGWKATIVRGP